MHEARLVTPAISYHDDKKKVLCGRCTLLMFEIISSILNPKRDVYKFLDIFCLVVTPKMREIAIFLLQPFWSVYKVSTTVHLYKDLYWYSFSMYVNESYRY